MFPNGPAPAVWRKHAEPDQVHKELQAHKSLTLQLVWQEARESNPEGCGYSHYVGLPKICSKIGNFCAFERSAGPSPKYCWNTESET